MGLLRSITHFLENFRTHNSENDLPESVLRTIEFVLKRNLTYLDLACLTELALSVQKIEADNIPGSCIETGCALGGSAIVTASAKNTEREFLIFDTFELIPPPSAKDGQDVHDRYEVIRSGQAKGIGGDAYYGYTQDLQVTVLNNFSFADYPVEPNNIKLFKGLYEDTLRISRPVAFAHIDCDWYDSVKMSLESVMPHLSSGAILVIDDYYTYSGCKKAVDSFLHENDGSFNVIRKKRLHLQRK